MPISVSVAFGVMPVFGVILFIANGPLGLFIRGERLVGNAAEVYATITVIAAIIVIALGGVPAESFVGFTTHPWYSIAAASILIPLSAAATYLFELVLSQKVGQGWQLSQDGMDIDSYGAVAKTMTIPRRYATIAIATAISEELLFRGAVYAEIKSLWGIGLAVLASSLLFGFHHFAFGVSSVLGKTLAGSLWSLLFVLSGTLLVSIASHLVFQYLVYNRMRRTAK